MGPRCILSELLPHRPPMILIDEIVSYDEASVVAGVTVRDASLFREPQPVQAEQKIGAVGCARPNGSVFSAVNLKGKVSPHAIRSPWNDLSTGSLLKFNLGV